MKKLILSLILLISFTFSFAQKSNVSKAKNKTLSETPDFVGAREAIKLALQDSTTNKLANTWYVAGLIGSKENDVLYAKAALKQPYDSDAKGKAILESYAYFLEAVRLDSLPDAKGKVKRKLTPEIKIQILSYYNKQQNLIAYGAYLFDKKDYESALNVFNTYLEIPKLSFLKNELAIDSTYKKIKYYAAIAAYNGKIAPKSISLLEELKADNYESLVVYKLLYEQYVKQNDTVNYVKTLKEGVEKLPSESFFLQNLINYYVFTGKVKEALVYLNTAIERDPKSAQYLSAKAALEEANGNLDEALISFDKAITLDNNLSEAYAGKGRLYFNKAVKMSETANNIKDVKLYKAEMKKVDAVFKESLPYFKKASDLKPKNIELKQNLKTLYYRLKMDAEYEAISKEISAM